MSEPIKIPNLQQVQQTVVSSRRRRQEVELAKLQLEEFIAKLEAENREQRRQYFKKLC
jgi:hypothetical protein